MTKLEAFCITFNVRNNLIAEKPEPENVDTTIARSADTKMRTVIGGGAILEMFLNVRGKAPMQRMKVFDLGQLGLSESEARQHLENAVRRVSKSNRDADKQMVIVQDGLIVAVQGLTTGKLIWTS